MTPPPLAYAVPDVAAVQLVRVRRIFMWFTLGHGIYLLIMSGATIFSMYSRTVSFGWVMVSSQIAALPLGVALIVGAALMMQKKDSGVLVIRWSAVAFCVANLASQVAIQFTYGVWSGSRISNVGIAVFGLIIQGVGVFFSMAALLFYFSFPMRRGTR